jgi:hypothetical protein
MKPQRRTLTDAVRETIIAGKAEGRTNAELIILSGFAESTVKMVLRDARDAGDMRAHYDPEIRAMARKQRAAAKAAHREGGESPRIAPPTLAPNSLELSLIMRGIRPEKAMQSARAWRDRHAQQDGGRGA